MTQRPKPTEPTLAVPLTLSEAYALRSGFGELWRAHELDNGPAPTNKERRAMQALENAIEAATASRLGWRFEQRAKR